MDRSMLPRELRPFVDDSGRLSQWPSRYKVQRMAVALIARRFEPARQYSERELNFLVMDGHTFADWALIRRSLVDWKFMARIGDGSRYWLTDQAAALIARELGTAAVGASVSAPGTDAPKPDSDRPA